MRRSIIRKTKCFLLAFVKPYVSKTEIKANDKELNKIYNQTPSFKTDCHDIDLEFL